MTEVNWEWIILIIIIGLVFFAGMGIFVGTRISSDKRRIRELEDELAETKKNLELYRSRVNSHFKKTSELFSEMTNSYRAVYMHLAQGSQDLCTTDAALLKPANEEFLKVAYEKKEESIDQPPAEEVRESAETPADKPVEPPEVEEVRETPEIEEPEKIDEKEEEPGSSEEQEQNNAEDEPGMKNESNQPSSVTEEEEKKQKADSTE